MPSDRVFMSYGHEVLCGVSESKMNIRTIVKFRRVGVDKQRRGKIE